MRDPAYADATITSFHFRPWRETPPGDRLLETELARLDALEPEARKILQRPNWSDWPACAELVRAWLNADGTGNVTGVLPRLLGLVARRWRTLVAEQLPALLPGGLTDLPDGFDFLAAADLTRQAQTAVVPGVPGLHDLLDVYRLPRRLLDALRVWKESAVRPFRDGRLVAATPCLDAAVLPRQAGSVTLTILVALEPADTKACAPAS